MFIDLTGNVVVLMLYLKTHLSHHVVNFCIVLKGTLTIYLSVNNLHPSKVLVDNLIELLSVISRDFNIHTDNP